MQLVSLALLGVWHPVELVPEPLLLHIMVEQAVLAVLREQEVSAAGVGRRVGLLLMGLTHPQPPHQLVAQYLAVGAAGMDL